MASSHRRLIPWLVIATGLLITVIAHRSLVAAGEAKERAEFARLSQTVAGVIEQSLHAHEEALHSLRNLFHYSSAVSRDEFTGISADLMARHPGILALEWAERVPARQRADVERNLRAAGFSDFEFKARGTGQKLRRAPDQSEHVPVLYIHPYDPNREALGFDLASSSIWPDMESTVREDRLFVSGRVQLITDRAREDDWGYIMQLPVYLQPGLARPEERREQFAGFVIGIFRPRDIIENALRRIGSGGFDLLVLDSAGPADRRTLHYRPAREGNGSVEEPDVSAMRADPRHQQMILPLSGRNWELHFRPTPGWLAEKRPAGGWLVPLGGVLGSLLLGLYLHGALRRSAIIEEQVRERTRELDSAQRLLEEDIRRRVETERRLRESESRLQAFIDHSPNSIFLKDDTGRYLLCSQQFAAFCGRPAPEVIGRTDAELFTPELAAGFRRTDAQVLRTGTTVVFEDQIPGPDQPRTTLVQKFPLRDLYGRIIGVGGISTDITERKQAEQDKLAIERRLLAAQKLESLGVLAGGIAHDFNNILTSVLVNASLARHDAAGGRPIDRSLEQIEHAARRAADLCQQMLAYAGKGKIVTAAVDLSDLVRDTSALLEVTISKSTRLELQLARGLPPVLGDQTQLRQIVMNLVINAADAIGGNPGRITVRTFACEADAALLHRALGHPELPPGRYAGLEVADNGCGMTPETVARIFEPFFTTKFSGRGLGLSAVLGIVQSHHGALFVESQVGAGSTFRLLLPVTGEPKSASVALTASPTPASLNATILVVDDEEAVRSIAATVLELHGATTLSARNGEEALAILGNPAHHVSAVLLDMTMPGLSGAETLRQLREIRPRLPVVFMSGYSEGQAATRGTRPDVAGFIQKPFEIDTLLAAIRAALG